jgi:hypothetical protein
MELRAVSDLVLADGITAAAVKACRAVGANAYARVDIRRSAETGIYYVLEVNAPPSVVTESTIEEILSLNGISFGEFIRDLFAYGAFDSVADTRRFDGPSFPGEAVRLAHDPVKGRCIRANADVGRGEDLFSASIDAFGVEDHYKRNSCHGCLAYSAEDLAVRCEACGEVGYCSEECRATDGGHAAECGPLREFHATFDGDWAAVTYYRTDIQALSRVLADADSPLKSLVTNYDKLDLGKTIGAWRIALRLDRFSRAASRSPRSSPWSVRRTAIVSARTTIRTRSPWCRRVSPCSNTPASRTQPGA